MLQVQEYSLGHCCWPVQLFAEFKVFGRNHPVDHLSLHPFFYNPALGYVDTDIIPFTQLTIGHDVWIGYNAIILPRVTMIGNGAIVAAAAVVTKDIPPYAVVGENPATVIKYRFPRPVIERVEELAWWNKDIESLRASLDDFAKPYGSGS